VDLYEYYTIHSDCSFNNQQLELAILEFSRFCIKVLHFAKNFFTLKRSASSLYFSILYDHLCYYEF
jgi:hypothetical protein